MRQFPKEFIFGAATAAYQAEGAVNEGGRGPCYWDEFLHRSESRFNGDVASDFYHQYPVDLKLSNEYGLNGIRISIAWSRVIPNGTGEVNEEGLAFYDRLIDECLANGVEPVVTLHHFDTPLSLFHQGDWLNRDNIDHFVRFAEVCFKRFGDRVKKWVSINEPWSVVAGQYIIGHFPPNIRYDVAKAIQAMHHMMIAHAKVVDTYKRMELDGEVGIIHILESKYPITESEEDREAAYVEDVLANQFMLDACLKGTYTTETLAVIERLMTLQQTTLVIEEGDMEWLELASSQNDFLGVNYYASHFLAAYEGESGIHHNGTGEKGTSVFGLKGIGKRVSNPDVPTTDWDWPIYPAGLTDMLVRVHRQYPNYKAMYVTENGMGYKDDLIDGSIDDTPRIDYIAQHLNAILDAIEQGVTVRGYFLWSLMDVLSWTNGFNKRYGLFYVDFETQERLPKKSARWMREVANRRQVIQPETVK
ncbi:6-phospho-beta-galactosidase [Exiguobacterium marinum]|uniref:6-phospho-beta-galactosidase n=1 Tax=Exiguobacterium marinum TaxID=273528 RepID=A0ABY7WWQ7_9BACL|nr:6-phospho-beta-galactosidase [Exiguobacterium marinum]WDH75308.1 6-phospho-beta-galactosidase [Exiguobacterium marinum]